MDHFDTADIPAEPASRPWIVLGDTYDVEAWIANYNRSLQAAIVDPKLQGYGICFTLSEGGDIFLHTDGEGNIVLDVTPEADWVAPLLTAATGYPAAAGRIWRLPAEVLTQLVFGLNSLIGSSRLVLSHDFRIKKI
ncbi:MAG TPA: hypothetical protein VGN04_04830 [Herbaspirillum sp.]